MQYVLHFVRAAASSWRILPIFYLNQNAPDSELWFARAKCRPPAPVRANPAAIRCTVFRPTVGDSTSRPPARGLGPPGSGLPPAGRRFGAGPPSRNPRRPSVPFSAIRPMNTRRGQSFRMGRRTARHQLTSGVLSERAPQEWFASLHHPMFQRRGNSRRKWRLTRAKRSAGTSPNCGGRIGMDTMASWKLLTGATAVAERPL